MSKNSQSLEFPSDSSSDSPSFEEEEMLFQKFGLFDKDGFLYPPGHRKVLVFIELKKQMDKKTDHTRQEKVLWIEATKCLNYYDKNLKKYEQEHFEK